MFITVLLLTSVMLLSVAGEGIPEPGLTLYGVVKNDLGGATVRLTSGALTWTIAPGTGSAVTVQGTLTNVLDQFSYIIEVPFESVLAGPTPSTNALLLRPTPTAYDRNQVMIGTNVAQLLSPAGTTFMFSREDRATVERVDLRVEIDYLDSDGDGLPDYWELLYFLNATSTNNGTGDFDGDGLNNRKEYLSGCNPTNPASCFEFINTRALPDGSGFEVRWSSQSDRYYAIHRSRDLLSDFEPLATGIPATPPQNTYQDTTATNGTAYFYRVAIE